MQNEKCLPLILNKEALKSPTEKFDENENDLELQGDLVKVIRPPEYYDDRGRYFAEMIDFIRGRVSGF